MEWTCLLQNVGVISYVQYFTADWLILILTKKRDENIRNVLESISYYYYTECKQLKNSHLRMADHAAA